MRYLLVGLAMMATPVAAQDRTYDMVGFEGIEASAGVVVEVVVGPDFSIAAEARKGNIDRLVVDLHSGTLKIERKSSWAAWLTGSEDQFFVSVSLPDLREAEVTSGATMTVSGNLDDPIDAEASSGATLRLQGLDVSDARLEASSGATLYASGRCGDISGEASSGATLNAEELSCTHAKVESSSGATLRARASGDISAEASSGASITMSGGGSLITEETSSGGRISLQ